MDPPDSDNRPHERDTARGYADDNPGDISARVLKAMSLLVVVAMILAGSSVIIVNTDNGLAVVLLIVAVAAALLVAWGFRSRNGEPGADR